MGLPHRTRKQRVEALALARHQRIEAARIREAIRAGEVTIGELIETIDSDPILKKIKVISLLCAIVGVSVKRATDLLEQARVSPSRRMGGMSIQQRKRLSEVLAQRHPAQMANSSS